MLRLASADFHRRTASVRCTQSIKKYHQQEYYQKEMTYPLCRPLQLPIILTEIVPRHGAKIKLSRHNGGATGFGPVMSGGQQKLLLLICSCLLPALTWIGLNHSDYSKQHSGIICNSFFATQTTTTDKCGNVLWGASHVIKVSSRIPHRGCNHGKILNCSINVYNFCNVLNTNLCTLNHSINVSTPCKLCVEHYP